MKGARTPPPKKLSRVRFLLETICLLEVRVLNNHFFGGPRAQKSPFLEVRALKKHFFGDPRAQNTFVAGVRALKQLRRDQKAKARSFLHWRWVVLKGLLRTTD